ncbi:hypothetical protein H9P43_007972 [Blastocladiella emersonii ATCC 22665]|nr:hypothetical protein H9P43_007972 [Blastocladiella emersonii ATCC 22665]
MHPHASTHHVTARNRPAAAFIDRLSDEVVALVLACLAPADMACAARVSRRWHRLSRDGSVWRTLFLRHFTAHVHDAQWAASIAAQSVRGPQWRALFRVQLNWSRGVGRAVRMVPTAMRAAAAGGVDLPRVYAVLPCDDVLVAAQGNVVDVFAADGVRRASVRVAPAEPIVGIFAEDGEVAVAMTPTHLHRIGISKDSATITTSVRHDLVRPTRPAHRTLPVVHGHLAGGTLAVVVLTETAASLSLLDTRTGRVVHTSHGLPTLTPLTTLAVHASLESTTFRVRVMYAAQLYTPAPLPPLHEVRVQHLSFCPRTWTQTEPSRVAVPSPANPAFASPTCTTPVPATHAVTPRHARITHLAYDAHGGYLAAGHADASVSVYLLRDTRVHLLAALSPTHACALQGVAVHAGTGRVVSVGADGRARKE